MKNPLSQLKNNLASAYTTHKNNVKASLKRMKAKFSPAYEVEFTLYIVIPGQSLKTDVKTYSFDKGDLQGAKEFFEKVVSSTAEIKLAPSEVTLKTKKGKLLDRKTFGPVDEVLKTIAA
ncbi:hypothetical protein [Sediminitomix flava]|uniref:Uncharacterized protein n=1 Tax=Sediminitomix flava TaxID=379075 RepID=A0A315Z6I4_SEDFL|nr:hypothetical protein [Sediminitomix flava]PWJ40028.1 hypothetical protein BC781_10591 [Sediminitomix flava]